LGMSTAHFVIHRNRPYEAVSSLMVVPVENGLALSYSAAFH